MPTTSLQGRSPFDAAAAFIEPYRLDDGAGFSCVCMALPAWSHGGISELTTNWPAIITEAVKSAADPGMIDLLVVSRDFEGTPIALLRRMPQGVEHDAHVIRRLCAAIPPEARYDPALLFCIPDEDTPHRFSPLTTPAERAMPRVHLPSAVVLLGVLRTLARSWGTTYTHDELLTVAHRHLRHPMLAEEALPALGAGGAARRLMRKELHSGHTLFEALAGPFGRGTMWLNACLSNPFTRMPTLLALHRITETGASIGLRGDAVIAESFGTADESEFLARALAWCRMSQPADFSMVDPGQMRRTARALMKETSQVPAFMMKNDFTPRSTQIPQPAAVLFDGLCRVPLDWLPKSPNEWTSALAVIAIAASLRRIHIPMEQSLRHIGGRWSDQCRALGRFDDHLCRLGHGESIRLWPEDGADTTADFQPDQLTLYVADMVRAFLSEVVRPAFEHAQGRELTEEESFKYVRPAAVSLLISNKGLTGIFDLADRWHTHAGRMGTAIRAISTTRHDELAWPPGIPHTTIEVGRSISIVPLTTETELESEGAPGNDPDGIPGLHHCVGGLHYLIECLRGSSRIVSLRTRNEEGAMIRLSTAQISVLMDGQAFAVAQHHGFRNRPPPPEAAEALRRYLESLNELGAADVKARAADLRPVPDAEHIAQRRSRRGYDPQKRENVEKALRIWEPMLPRPLRGLPLEDFIARARATVLKPPTRRPWFERR